MFSSSYSLGRRESCARVPRTLVFHLPTYLPGIFVGDLSWFFPVSQHAITEAVLVYLYERESGRTGRPADVLRHNESFIVKTTATTTYMVP